MNAIRRGMVQELVLFGSADFVTWLKRQNKPFDTVEKLKLIGLKSPSILVKNNDLPNYHIDSQNISKFEKSSYSF